MSGKTCPLCRMDEDEGACKSGALVRMWCGAMVPHSEMVDGYHPDHHPKEAACCVAGAAKFREEKLTDNVRVRGGGEEPADDPAHEQAHASATAGGPCYVHALVSEALMYEIRECTLTFEGLRAWAIDLAVIAHKRATRGLRGGDPTDRIRGMSYTKNEDGEVRTAYQAEALKMLQDLDEAGGGS